MHSQPPTPSSGRGSAARGAPRRSGAIPYMSERQLQAYLLARDAVRRVQRTSSLVGESLKLAAGEIKRNRRDQRQGQQGR